MDTDRPFKALTHCEEELRKFAAEAAAKGDYDMLARLGATARAISEITREWQSGPTGPNSSAAAPIASRPEGAEQPGSDPGRPRGRGGRSPASRAYPRFVRRGDELVKIGWSRKDRREYQHRAAHGVLAALRQTLLDSSKHRRLFTMEALERVLTVNKLVVPGYQGYVWLAWLRTAGLVKQHGRQGYSLVKPATFEKDVERVLAAVPAQEP